MTDLLARCTRRLNALFGLGPKTPEPPAPLDCGCPDDGPRYLFDCSHTACELHRHDPHHCEEPAHA